MSFGNRNKRPNSQNGSFAASKADPTQDSHAEGQQGAPNQGAPNAVPAGFAPDAAPASEQSADFAPDAAPTPEPPAGFVPDTALTPEPIMAFTPELPAGFAPDAMPAPERPAGFVPDTALAPMAFTPELPTGFAPDAVPAPEPPTGFAPDAAPTPEQPTSFAPDAASYPEPPAGFAPDAVPAPEPPTHNQPVLFQLLLQGVPANDPHRRVLERLNQPNPASASKAESGWFKWGQKKKIQAKIITEDCLGSYLESFFNLLNSDLSHMGSERMSLNQEWNQIALPLSRQGGSDGVRFLLEARNLFFDAQNLARPFFLNALFHSIQTRQMTPTGARAQIHSFTAAIRAHVLELNG